MVKGKFHQKVSKYYGQDCSASSISLFYGVTLVDANLKWLNWILTLMGDPLAILKQDLIFLLPLRDVTILSRWLIYLKFLLVKNIHGLVSIVETTVMLFFCKHPLIPFLLYFTMSSLVKTLYLGPYGTPFLFMWIFLILIFFDIRFMVVLLLIFQLL